MADHVLLELRDVSKRFVKPLDTAARIAKLFGAQREEEVVHAVDHANLSIHSGEVVGLVGESGCGKSTLGRMAVGLHSLSSGSRWWQGEDMAQLTGGELRRKQLAMQMIFQDPYASLNPRMRIQDIVGEAPLAHGMVTRTEQQDYVAGLLQKVGLDPALVRRFPHQFSGGQRARIGIARALAVQPELLVCDEAVAALDVSIQAQVLNLFIELRNELNLTYLFISHDLKVVRALANTLIVLRNGKVVEQGPAAEIFAAPQSPYTQALLAAAFDSAVPQPAET